MKKTLLLPLFLLVFGHAHAQQLISNPTFQGTAQSAMDMGGYAITNMATHSIPTNALPVDLAFTDRANTFAGTNTFSQFLIGNGGGSFQDSPYFQVWDGGGAQVLYASGQGIILQDALPENYAEFTETDTLIERYDINPITIQGEGTIAITNTLNSPVGIVITPTGTTLYGNTVLTNGSLNMGGNAITNLQARSLPLADLATNGASAGNVVGFNGTNAVWTNAYTPPTNLAYLNVAQTFTATQTFATNQASYFSGNGAGLTNLILTPSYFTLSGTSAGWYRVATINGSGPVTFNICAGVPGGISLFTLVVNTTNGVFTAEVIGNSYLYTQFFTQFRLGYASSGLGYLDLYATGGATSLSITQNSNALLQFTANPSTTGLTTQTYNLPSTGSFFSDSLTTTGQFNGSGAGLTSNTIPLPSLSNAGASTNSILTYGGSSWGASGLSFHEQVFTNSGTFTNAPGVTSVHVLVTGAAGGTPTSGGSYESGGGAGGTAIKSISGLTNGQTIAVTVGTCASATSTGGNSSFGSYCTGYGGSPGAASSGQVGGGAGGSATGGDLNMAGGNGLAALTANIWNGGTSYWGGGGSAYGAGSAAGAGNPGVVVVQWIAP